MEKAIQLQQGRNFVLRFQMNIRVNIQMMDERTKKKNRGTYGKDIKFVRSNVMTPGVTESRTLKAWVSHDVGN